MKRILLCFTILIAISADAQVQSIYPNSGTYGQTLVTTITMSNGVMTMGSPPMQMNDIYLKQGTDVIYATNFTLYPIFPGGPSADTLSATFDIPLVTPPGLYDVHVITYDCPGCPGGPTPVDHVLSNGFFIGVVVGHAEGDVYYDANQNGLRDTAEVGLSNKLVTANPPGLVAITDINGHYDLALDSGSTNIGITVTSPWTLTSVPSTYSVTIPPDTSGLDFGLYAPPSAIYTQEFFILKNWMRCLQRGSGYWNLINNSFLPQQGSVTFMHSPNLTYDSSEIAPTSVTATSVTWNYQVQPFQNVHNAYYFIAPPAGDTVSWWVVDSLFDMSGTFQRAYVDSFKFVVRCSYDPNDKACSPVGEGGQHFTLKNSDLEYTIRFQNTGNDTAFNIVILDTLDINLDESTIEVVGSSHNARVQIDNNRQVSFSFDNIMLADSFVDEPNSHGFIAYRIRAMNGVPDFTPVENTAHIIFDLNAPVVTNTTLNTLVTQIPTSISEFGDMEMNLVYPNPLTDASILYLPNSTTYDLKIFDETGRVVLRKSISGNYQLPKNKFSSGVYYYQLREKNSVRSVGKFVVVD